MILEKRFNSEDDTPDPLVKEFSETVVAFFDAIGQVLLIPTQVLKYYETKAHKAFDTHFEKMYVLSEYFIAQRVNQLRDNGKLLSSSLGVNDKEEVSLFEYLSNKKGITEKELLFCIMDLLFAGIETVSNTMQLRDIK